jgi:hypothetical protein
MWCGMVRLKHHAHPTSQPQQKGRPVDQRVLFQDPTVCSRDTSRLPRRSCPINEAVLNRANKLVCSN